MNAESIDPLHFPTYAIIVCVSRFILEQAAGYIFLIPLTSFRIGVTSTVTVVALHDIYNETVSAYHCLAIACLRYNGLTVTRLFFPRRILLLGTHMRQMWSIGRQG